MIAPQIKDLIEKWGSVYLGEIVEIIGGKSAPQKSEAFSESGIPLVRMKDLGSFHLTTNLNSTVDTLSKEYVNNSKLWHYEENE